MKITKLVGKTLLAALAVTSFSVNAGNIDATAARAAASRFLQQKSSAMFKGAPTSALKLSHAEASKVSGNAYYVFNIEGGGWVIIAGEDRAKQVLAYGDKGNIDMANMPASMKGQLDLYKNQIEALQSYKGRLEAYKAPRRIEAVDPLTTITWGQNEPMDRWCPMKGSSRTAVGCGPLAMAQIVYFWKYPAGCDRILGYYVSMEVGSLSNLEATTFDYDLMMDSYTIYNPATGGVKLGTYTDEQAEAVAKLCRYCGQACNARYGNAGTSTGSYSYDQLAAFKFFGYNQDAQLIGIDPSYYCDNFGHKYTNEEWLELICTELKAGRPIPYHNVDFIDGHAWVLDGIDADGLLHMNWGYYEKFNGWFELTALSFHPYDDDEVWNFTGDANEMIINLYPEGYNPSAERGDVNKDGIVGIGDVTALVDYILSHDDTGIDLVAADCDLNSEIGINDVTTLVDYIMSHEW
jgi:hypothetical protein